MKAVLNSPRHPEYGDITVPFPIPRDEYDRTMDLLDGLGIGDVLRQDCHIAVLESDYPALARLEDAVVNVDELDCLAKHMDSFCESEDHQFLAMAHKLDISSIRDFINLTLCYQQATVITDFSNLEKIGKDHILTVNFGIPLEEYQAVDGRKEALQLIQDGDGTITPYGVVYDNGMELEQVYDGMRFPPYIDGPTILAWEAADGAEGCFCLPMSDRQLQRAQIRAGIENPETPLTLEMDDLPDEAAGALDLDHLTVRDLPDLNRLCQAIEQMSKADREKLGALVQLTESPSIKEVCRLAENLDQFGLIPGVFTPEEYGKYMIRESGHFAYDENLEEFYDFRSYGEKCILHEGGQFTEFGYVVSYGSMTLAELVQNDSAEQHQWEQGM